jgi:hypothetical protein
MLAGWLGRVQPRLVGAFFSREITESAVAGNDSARAAPGMLWTIQVRHSRRGGGRTRPPVAVIANTKLSAPTS